MISPIRLFVSDQSTDDMKTSEPSTSTRANHTQVQQIRSYGSPAHLVLTIPTIARRSSQENEEAEAGTSLSTP